MYYTRVLNKPEIFKKSFQDKGVLNDLKCSYCSSITLNKTKRFSNTRSLYFHLKQFHAQESTLNTVLEILNFVSKARQIGMIK